VGRRPSAPAAEDFADEDLLGEATLAKLMSGDYDEEMRAASLAEAATAEAAAGTPVEAGVEAPVEAPVESAVETPQPENSAEETKPAESPDGGSPA
jgi:hypothetical protein